MDKKEMAHKNEEEDGGNKNGIEESAAKISDEVKEVEVAAVLDKEEEKKGEVVGAAEEEPESLNVRRWIAMNILIFRCKLKRSLNAEVYNHLIPGLESLSSKLEDSTGEERLYLIYFKAYCLKKMGFIYEAKNLLHSFADLPQSDTIRFKITVKLAKIYTDLWNHFEARCYLRNLKDMLTNNVELSSNLKMKAAYYQAKCKYYLKLGIPSKLSANVDKLIKCQEQLKIRLVHRISTLNYKIMSEMKSLKK